MIDFLLSLIFGSITLLTPAPIDIQHKTLITLSKPISAITDGATIQIDMSSTIPAKNGLMDGLDAAKTAYPTRSITGMLSQSKGMTSVQYIFFGQIIMTKEGARILLEPTTKLPKKVKFDRVTIVSEVELKQVKLYWKNVREF
jgi:hypothetical protein